MLMRHRQTHALHYLMPPQDDMVWTSALRAAEGECDNKTLVYKAYKYYARDFNLTAQTAQNAQQVARNVQFTVLKIFK